MIDALRRRARQWLADGRPALLVQVIEHRGSVPRETGTRMLVAADAVAGSIGGGHLELKAIQQARQQLASGGAGPHDQHYPLGPALGQCCGGAVTLRTAPLDAGALAAWPDEPTLFDLQLYGAGHVGRAIVRLLATLACRVAWIDERADEFPPEPAADEPAAGLQANPAAHIERRCVEPVAFEVRSAPAGAFYLVLTHRHDLDLSITEAILRRGDFGYLGLIGSATKRARFLSRLTQRGIAPEVLARLTCPIGLPGIHGKQPEVIALAVVAQLLHVSAQAQATEHADGASMAPAPARGSGLG